MLIVFFEFVLNRSYISNVYQQCTYMQWRAVTVGTTSRYTGLYPPAPSVLGTGLAHDFTFYFMFQNMVGPGDVDEELEPEVKDECNTKYGDVIKVVIFELPNAPADEAVRIFVEFKRIESAIKAVVDLNGRFFGGRQVKAGFYDVEKFGTLQLNE